MPLRHVLYPRTKGFVATVQTLRGHITAVYDVTIGYVGGVPSMWQWTRGNVPRVHIHVRRFPVDRLPAGDTALAEWLVAGFRAKDALLDALYRDGTFPAAVPAPAGEIPAAGDVRPAGSI